MCRAGTVGGRFRLTICANQLRLERRFEFPICSALYAAHASHQPVDVKLIAAELEATKPLSVVMGEKIAELRDWAAERTVPAD